MFGALGGLISAGAGLLGSKRSGRNNPGEAGMQYLNRIPEYGYNAYNPFINKGAEAEKQLYPEYQRMAYQPVDWLRNLESQYQETPGFQYKKNQLTRGAHNTAAAGGFAGTPFDEQRRAEMVNSLLSGDMQQYLQNVFGIGEAGRGGLEERVNRGFNASTNLADYLGNVEGARAGYAGYGAAHKNQMQNNTWNALSNLINTGISGLSRGSGMSGMGR